MVQFENMGMVFYSLSTVTMDLSCTISKIKRENYRKSRFFSYPLHSTLPLEGPRWSFAISFGTEKLEWCGYPMVKYDDMFSRFDRMPWCDRQSDRRTDRQTPCDSIVRAMHSIAR